MAGLSSMMRMAPIQTQHSYNNPLQGYIGRKGDRTFHLVIEQQPIRARMCGFGDKDRRPITPPPCIRLIVKDYNTGKEVPVNEVDSTFFVLTVDLWDEHAKHEVNLVRHSTGAPTVSISSSTITSYPPPPDRAYYMAPMPMPMGVPMQHSYGQPMTAAPPPMSPYAPGPPMHQGYYQQAPATPVTPGSGFQYPPAPPHAYAPPPMPVQVAAPPAQATGMFTRNLIGSLTVNAFKLHDTENKVGFWFVLQDLSVRTEGTFRLKMNFVDVGSGAGNNTLNQGRAPVLATVFSDQFQVYSAKKFPGVIESTPLSKVFAGQGIKIPIRKDGPKQLPNQAEYDADD
ncbi:hypothetical protein W97_05954 [Coniosporium apollinis CBS 100218]|uniref:Velvet domain-containing protein n=1 Tax=Coniosporium apollinis (strain CBS 100218) TaxID=1168221 RepID=R7YXY1_CONA1|nr:uncharacterized protein W97_05954 [Coniosporium apollinis CBS 100218]EON66708.1 hypothetical protein W97_05954 [Coniosporium apollinis CBS 100218]